MKLVIQTVNSCTLSVDDKVVSQIGYGLCVFVGVNRDDNMDKVAYLAKKLTHLRIFPDENGKHNNSVLDIGGEVMVISNFTLNAEIGSGTRPSYSHSADYETADRLYLALRDKIEEQGVAKVVTGSFRSHMHISSQIDGPINIVLEK